MTTTSHPFSGLGKYRGVVLSVTILSALFLGILLVAFYTALQISKDAGVINAAARQRVHLESIYRASLAMADATRADPEALSQSMASLDLGLLRFRNGGPLIGPQGQPVYVKASTTAARTAAVEAQESWKFLQPKLQPLVESPDAAAISSALDALEKWVPLMNQALARLTEAMETNLRSRASNLKFFFAAGLLLALGGFLIIVINIIGKLGSSDFLVERAQREVTEIMDTVSEGLFLLDRDGRIGNQYSGVLERLFGRSDLGGQRLVDVLKELVPEKTLQVTQDYVEVLFQEHVKEKLIGSLNPLNEVPIHLDDGKGGFITRHLAFGFKRALGEDKKLLHVLVTVDDISAQVALAKELEESRRHAEEQMDLLVKMLHVEPPTLQQFLNRTDQSLLQVNQALKSRVGKRHRYREVLNVVFPIIHSIKGEAALLGLDMFEKRAHEFEEKVGELRSNPTLEGNDLLTLAVRLDQLMDVVTQVRDMVDRLLGLSSAFADSRDDDTLFADVGNLLTRIAQDQGKQVVYSHHGLDQLQIPDNTAQVLRDALIQLGRNAITHGIESPGDRERVGKSAIGHVLLQFRFNKGVGEFAFRDDGRGISADMLREAAVRSGRYNKAELASWDNRRLMSLLFESGFSTMEEATMDAGRGVGMDVIKNRIAALGGKLRLNTRTGRYCEWRILLPANTLVEPAGSTAALV